MPNLSHPGDDVLSALVSGQLTGEAAAAFAEHIEGCERCTERTAHLAAVSAQVRRGGQERHLVPESAKGSGNLFWPERATKRPKGAKGRGGPMRPYVVASVAAGVLVGALVTTRLAREPLILDLTTRATNRAVRTPSLRVFAGTAQGPVEIEDSLVIEGGTRLAPKGARGQLRFFAEIPESLVLTLLTVDDQGRVGEVPSTLDRQGAQAEGARRGFLSARMLPTRDTRIFALFTATAPEPAALRSAAQRAFDEAGRTLSAMKGLAIDAAHVVTRLVVFRSAK